MRTLRIALVAPLTVGLAACPADQPPVEIELATEPDPVVTEGTRQTELQDMVGIGISGELVMTPFPDSILIHITVNDGPPESILPARAHSGSCAAPGPVVTVLAAIRTGVLGNGRSQRSLDEEAHRVVLDGNHVAAIYAEGAAPESDRPIACAPIPPGQ
jgi:hypothetical protein